MPSSHLSSMRVPERRSGRAEHGVGLVEIVVVVLIVLVLMTLAVSAFRGTKRTNHFKAAQAAASSYGEAIEAYMADNGQRPPRMGRPEWPSSPRASLVGGPVDAMLRTSSGAPKRYMPRAAPDAVSDGLVDVIGPGGSPSGSAQAWITYSEDGSTYLLRVTGRQVSGDPPLECGITNAPALPAGVRRCE